MNNNVFRNSSMIGIIILFIGASIIPSISSDIENIEYKTNVENNIGFQIESIETENYEQIVGNILITEEREGNRVIEVDNSGNIVWEKTGLDNPEDAERLDNGNILIAEYNGGDGRVIEVNSSGNIVWQKTGVDPIDVERLDNGNTLITENKGNRVIEVDNSGSIVWQKTGLDLPWDAERLSNGNTLISTNNGQRVIEVNSGGSIIWKKTGLSAAWDIERLDNGNTLIAQFGGSIFEVNSGGSIVWQLTLSSGLCDAERLDNGNTLIAEYWENRIIEINSGGNIVWQKILSAEAGPVDAERISEGNQPPIADFTWTPQYPNPEETVTFDASDSYDPNGYITLYEWDWDDDGMVDENHTSSTATHNWSQAGIYPVTLRVTDNDSLIDEITKKVYVGVGVPNVEQILGGFRVSADIKNVGDEIVTDIYWSINLSGGLIIQGQHSEGLINELGPGESETVRQPNLFGIGKDVMITVTADGASKQAVAKWVLGPLVIGVT